ncbi:MAG: serine/threonine protein kinase [Planctomycetota bacterium]|jgi:serine/threonine protein kinase
MTERRQRQQELADCPKQGSKLGGLRLRRLIAHGTFSSVWLTKPLQEGFIERCLRVIPAESLRAADAYERLCSELAFWKDLSGRCAVDLYDCGVGGDYYFMLMRYIPEGSVVAQLERDSWLREHMVEFATEFASVLRDLHSVAGAHGNLKPSNVFPMREEGVLLSDFSIPLWLDELDRGCTELAPGVLHPYRAPEQRDVLRDFDTRSDVYSFALVLLYCITGLPPGRNGEPPEVAPGKWPAGLRGPIQRCLSPDRDKRPADGFELLEILQDVLEPAPGAAPVVSEEAEPAPPPEEQESRIARRLDEAKALIEDGLLEEAVGVLESLPAATEEVAELLDQIEAQEKSCRELADEAVRLAGTGYTAAAMEAIEQAQKLWAKSKTVMAVRAELTARAERESAPAPGEVPEDLRAALQEERYAAARALLEKHIRENAVTEEIAEAISQFKAKRVRRAFLDSIQNAKRLCLQGHPEESKEQWLEAARWLPGGPERERLRKIARAAGEGKLRVDAEAVDAAALPEGADPELGDVQPAAEYDDEWQPAGTPPRIIGWRWYLLLCALALLAFIIVGGLTLLAGLLGG